MKLSALEEYGLRCLLRMARAGRRSSVTIPEISQSEGLSQANTAKLLRLLRLAGLAESVRGKDGGYRLARPAGQISVREALEVLGGPFFSPEFCESHSGVERQCVHSADCSIRPLLRAMQNALDRVLGSTTLEDLLCQERNATVQIQSHISAQRG